MGQRENLIVPHETPWCPMRHNEKNITLMTSLMVPNEKTSLMVPHEKNS